MEGKKSPGITILLAATLWWIAADRFFISMKQGIVALLAMILIIGAPFVWLLSIITVLNLFMYIWLPHFISVITYGSEVKWESPTITDKIFAVIAVAIVISSHYYILKKDGYFIDLFEKSMKMMEPVEPVEVPDVEVI